MKNEITNTSASIHQKLLNLARATNRSFNDLLYIYANERFLYRLSISPHESKFILKGAMAILNLSYDHPRYTRDIDLLGFTNNSIQDVEKIIREICTIDVISDGLKFKPNSVSGKLIKENEQYPGVRVNFNAALGNAKIPNLQIDVGIGDTVHPQAQKVSYLGLLELPQAVIRIYPPETILAEKIQTIQKYGLLNSRMKDVYDIWLIASNQKIDGAVLSKALDGTFKNRQTQFPELLIIFQEGYLSQSRINAWKSIGKKLQSIEDLPELSFVLDRLNIFINPIMRALYYHEDFTMVWNASENWSWQ